MLQVVYKPATIAVGSEYGLNRISFTAAHFSGVDPALQSLTAEDRNSGMLFM